MLDALFAIGTFIVKKVVDIAVKTAKAVVRELINDVLGDVLPAQNQRQNEMAKPSTQHLDDIGDLDEEVTDIERKRRRDGRLSDKDQDRLRVLELRRIEEARGFREAKQHEILTQAQATNTDYVAPILTDSKVHVLQYHMGQVVLEKRCLYCGFSMVLQHKRIEKPSLFDFFWSCTRYYQLNNGEEPCPLMKFRPSNISLLHQEGIPELEENRDDLEIVTQQSIVQQAVQKRVLQHLGDRDDDILCPIHYLAMTLREKGANDGTLIDMYYLMCPHHGCKQTVKLKSIAQIAAYLRRQEGKGIL